MINDDSDDSEGDDNDDDTKWHKIAFWWRTDQNHYGENRWDEGDNDDNDINEDDDDDDDGINDEDDDGYDGSTNLHVSLDDSSAYSG